MVITYFKMLREDERDVSCTPWVRVIYIAPQIDLVSINTSAGKDVSGQVSVCRLNPHVELLPDHLRIIDVQELSFNPVLNLKSGYIGNMLTRGSNGF